MPKCTTEDYANWTTTWAIESTCDTSEDREESTPRDRKSRATATETETEVGANTKPRNQGSARFIENDCCI